jgi:hypothetical protein
MADKKENQISAVYCKKCFKRLPVDKKTGLVPAECPFCHEKTDGSLTLEEKTPLVQALHKQENHFRDLNDRAMSCVVLGAIFIIIGIIFFNLAYKLDLSNPADNTKHLTTTTFEFWTSMVALVGGGVSFIYGLVQLIIDTRHLRVLKHDIDAINEKGSTNVESTGLWAVEFSANAKIIIANKKAIAKAKKEREAAEKNK